MTGALLLVLVLGVIMIAILVDLAAAFGWMRRRTQAAVARGSSGNGAPDVPAPPP